MTPLVSPRIRRGASLALCGMVIATGIMLGSAPVVWAVPDTDAVNAIEDRYTTFGGAGSLLGAPIGEAADVQGGAAREYQGGTIYYSKDTGAHVMYGAILDRYKTLGGPGSDLGFPKNDESDTGDGTGRFNDFSAPEGASIYWTPQWGASVIKGKVLEAWRQSGGVTGPFGYPSADTAMTDGIQTGKFVGPEGTEIQWSQAAGLVTIPAALAGTIPGFGTAATPTAEGTTPVTTPTLSTPAAPETDTKSSKWWWIPVGLAVAALLAGLARMLRRKPEPEPVRAAAPAPVRKVAPTPPPPPPAPPAPRPVAKAPAPKPPPPAPPAPPAPPRPPAPKPPAKVVPLAKTPPPAPKPVTPPPPPPAPRPLMTEPPKATIHTASVEHDVAPVIKYASSAPADTTIQVTYENNAVDGEASRADKSDLTPDHLQE